MAFADSGEKKKTSVKTRNSEQKFLVTKVLKYHQRRGKRGAIHRCRGKRKGSGTREREMEEQETTPVDAETNSIELHSIPSTSGGMAESQAWE